MRSAAPSNAGASAPSRIRPFIAEHEHPPPVGALGAAEDAHRTHRRRRLPASAAEQPARRQRRAARRLRGREVAGQGPLADLERGGLRQRAAPVFELDACGVFDRQFPRRAGRIPGRGHRERDPLGGLQDVVRDDVDRDRLRGGRLPRGDRQRQRCYHGVVVGRGRGVVRVADRHRDGNVAQRRLAVDEFDRDVQARRPRVLAHARRRYRRRDRSDRAQQPHGHGVDRGVGVGPVRAPAVPVFSRIRVLPPVPGSLHGRRVDGEHRRRPVDVSEFEPQILPARQQRVGAQRQVPPVFSIGHDGEHFDRVLDAAQRHACPAPACPRRQARAESPE